MGKPRTATRIRRSSALAALCLASTAVACGDDATTATTTNSPAVIGPEVHAGAEGLSGRTVVATDGRLEACVGTHVDQPAATYAPTIVLVGADGRSRWAWCPPVPNSAMVAGEVDGIVLARFWESEASYVVAFDASNGRPVWWRPLGWNASVSIDASGIARIIDAASVDATTDVTTIVTPRTGAERKVTPPSTDPLIERTFPGLNAVVTVDRDIDRMSGHTLRVRDTRSGAERWSRNDLGTFRPIDSIDAAAGGVLVVSLRETPMTMGLDLATGATRWQVSLPTVWKLADPRIGMLGSVVLTERAGSAGPEIVAYATADGTQLWTTDHPLIPYSPRQTQGGSNEVVLTQVSATTSSGFEVRDATTGHVRWTGSGDIAAVGANRLAGGSGSLGLFDLESGKHLADIEVPCLGTRCTLTEGYVERIAIHDNDVILAMNDFGGR